MSFDRAWASHFSDPAWVAIELYARVVSPLQLVVEFPNLPYIPFGQQNGTIFLTIWYTLEWPERRQNASGKDCIDWNNTVLPARILAVFRPI